MDKKELIAVPQRKINNYLFNASLLCIILAYDNLKPWFYENYLQIYFNPKKSDIYSNQGWLDFYGGWTLPQQVLEYKEFERNYFENVYIIDFIESCIEQGNYIFTYIDEYYIDNAMYFGKHFVHDTFIYGYDRKKQQISVIAYDNNSNFSKYTISYSSFESAFSAAMKTTENKESWNEKYCVLYKCKYDNNYEYKFNLKKFLENLSDYLYSVNTALKDKPDYQLYLSKDNIFGINVYDGVLNHLNGIEKGSQLFYPSIHTLYEHKLALKERLQYISNNFGISDNFSELVDKTDILIEAFDTFRLLAIKYNALHKENLIEKMCSIIEEQKGFEKELLSNVCDAINNYIIQLKYNEK
ncbi:MAG: hypothetical protein BWY74_03742 [Firmicutes bacterium ADurb.Bin419]|nr:MAG: hypothetical protein BWY74_03742 [Firmicutes bacterium ADurb.Bin419]